MTTDTLREALATHRLVAILRARSEAPLLSVMRTLVDAGVRVVEVTLPSPGSLTAIRAAAAEFGEDVMVGAGTVVSADEVDEVASAGARFVVSPNIDPAVVAAARRAGLGSLPGAFTPTEVMTAWRCGPSAVKVFPATSLGQRFVSDLAGPLPDIPLVPTGGVGLTETSGYLSSGALAVGVGSPLLGDALSGGSLDELRDRAKAFVSTAVGDHQ